MLSSTIGAVFNQKFKIGDIIIVSGSDSYYGAFEKEIGYVSKFLDSFVWVTIIKYGEVYLFRNEEIQLYHA